MMEVRAKTTMIIAPTITDFVDDFFMAIFYSILTQKEIPARH
jgi:hypothetical protein